MKNQKGMTLVEIIVSIVLVSIILIFITKLLINVNDLYRKSKQEVDYDVLNTILTDAIGKDILNYGVASASINDSKNEVTITYNEVRETKLNKQIIKKISFGEDYTYIKYGYVDDEDLTSEERSSNIARKLPDGIILDKSNLINLIKFTEENNNGTSSHVLNKIKINLKSKTGEDYSINIYFKTN